MLWRKTHGGLDALALVLLLVDHLAHGGVEPIQGTLVGSLVTVG